MILILSGTGDGRWLTRELAERGYRVGVVVTTSYGYQLAKEDGASFIEYGRPAVNPAWLNQMNARAVVDARHTFAREDSEQLARLCHSCEVLYLVLGREETRVKSSPLLRPVLSMREAAEKAVGLGSTIFLTTGSHGLENFTGLIESHGMRLIVRVLPEHRVIKKCQDMGIKPRDIVAMQGPFSKQINKALFKMYRASVVVTKDSGRAGGADTKIDAALSLNIPVLLVKHPDTRECEHTREEILSIVSDTIAPTG